MGAGAKILSELSDDAVRWVESLADKLSRRTWNPKNVDEAAADMGEKLINLDRLAPQMFRLYEDKPLYQILDEANAGESDIALLDPRVFRAGAARIPMDDPLVREEVAKQVNKYADDIRSGIPIDDTPFFGFDYDASKGTAQITAHDGRHRSRAFEATGEPVQLVRFVPAGQYDPAYGKGLLSSAPPDTKLLTEKSNFQIGPESQSIGTLGDLLKFLSVAGIAAPGALSMMGGQNGSEVP